jgi:hypothetical protein
MPKAGDVVLYSAFGRTLKAIVLDARLGEVSHHGANGEPVLDLIFIDPARETAIEKKQIGWKPHIYTEYDVVHISHEFSVEFRKLKGLMTPAQIATARGQGEWREDIAGSVEDSILARQHHDELHARVEELEDRLAKLYASAVDPDPVNTSNKNAALRKPGELISMTAAQADSIPDSLYGGMQPGVKPDDLPSGIGGPSYEKARAATTVPVGSYQDLGIRGSALRPSDPKDIPNSIDTGIAGMQIGEIHEDEATDLDLTKDLEKASEGDDTHDTGPE